VGLYSARARRHVDQARSFIASRGDGCDLRSIRRVRQELLADPSRWAAVTRMRDFYTASECRDLLFHVQERSFSLPQIAAHLDTLGLQFLGFLHEPSILHDYRRAF